VTVKGTVFRDVTPCSPIVHMRFVGTYQYAKQVTGKKEAPLSLYSKFKFTNLHTFGLCIVFPHFRAINCLSHVINLRVHHLVIYDCKVKRGKVVPVLTNSALRHEGVWESECIDPHFFDLGTSWR
jgi:hypothetical protein